MNQALVARTATHDPQALGQLLADSGYFSDARGAAQAAVKVMAGAELGFPPIQSMMGVYIVKGKVTLSANLMAAAIKRHPAYTFRVKEHTNDRCVIDFLENGEVIGTSEFSMEDAQKANLAGSPTWKSFPKNMLYARALSNGAKWYCPDVFGGPIYTPDELGAEVDGETGELVGQSQPVWAVTEQRIVKSDIPADVTDLRGPQPIEKPAEPRDPALVDEPFANEIRLAMKRLGISDPDPFRKFMQSVGVEDLPSDLRSNRSRVDVIAGLSKERAAEIALTLAQMEKQRPTLDEAIEAGDVKTEEAAA